MIRRYAMHDLKPDLAKEVAAHVGQHVKGIAIKRLKKDLGLSQEQMFALVAHRQIAFNKALLISDDDLLFPTYSEIKNASIQFGDWFGCAPWVPTA